MGTEITRAGDADRQRYVDHLNELVGDGYVSPVEAEALRDQIMRARSLKVLNDTLSGMPLPPMPRQRRDWGIPERWVPVTIGIGLVGALVAAVPPTALAHHHDSLSNSLSVTFIVVGIMIIVAAIVAASCAAVSWENAGTHGREQRRSADRNRKNQSR